jgi:hypothetical protein
VEAERKARRKFIKPTSPKANIAGAGPGPGRTARGVGRTSSLSKLTPMDVARADWRRRLLSWHYWLLIVLGGGFVLFSVVLTIWLLILGP